MSIKNSLQAEERPLPSVARLSLPFLAILFVAMPLSVLQLSGQTTSTPAGVPANGISITMQDALNALQPTLTAVNTAVGSIEVRRWKVPGEVKDQTVSDVQSIQRDISGSLPGLITQAQGSLNEVGPSFSVFRNIDALYDVLLRVSETATLAGSQQEASQLESARTDLQMRRRQLGDALLSSATAQDASVSQLRNSLAAAQPAAAGESPANSPKKIVVDDGPTTTAKTIHEKKTVKPATAAAAPQ